MHFRRRAVDSPQAQHQRDRARSAIAFVGRVRAVAAVALPVAALHGMESHPRAIHAVATKRQHAQARFAVQRQAQITRPVDEIGADGTPCLTFIGRKASGLLARGH